MISIKKYLDLNATELRRICPPAADDLLTSISEAYRETLEKVGACGLQACPATGQDLRRNLERATEPLEKEPTPALIQETKAQVEQHLQLWGEQTAKYLGQRMGDVKEILLTLGRVSESIAERDRHYGTQFGEFTKHFQSLANLDDLPQLRAAVIRGATELRSCVTKMEVDSRESMAALRTKVSVYQEKLEEAERRASRDPLTGLDNRQSVEEKVQQRIEGGINFCVFILDLNNFKEVNDGYGHEAGDDILRQFSTELRSVTRSTDIVGRWGGDEFIVVFSGSLVEAELWIKRARQWVFGAYKCKGVREGAPANVTAAIGVAQRQPGETLKEVVARADRLMYEEKKRPAEKKKQAQPTAA